MVVMLLGGGSACEFRSSDGEGGNGGRCADAASGCSDAQAAALPSSLAPSLFGSVSSSSLRTVRSLRQYKTIARMSSSTTGTDRRSTRVLSQRPSSRKVAGASLSHRVRVSRLWTGVRGEGGGEHGRCARIEHARVRKAFNGQRRRGRYGEIVHLRT